MSDETRPAGGSPTPGEFAPVVVQRKRGISLVWIIPIVAGAIGAWLWWQAKQQQGPEIHIEFSTADGLEAGKTKIRFKSVEIGEVERVALKPDLSGVVVAARMGPETAPLLRESSRFWVVRPRIGLGGVTGLSTLLSGAYIEVDPGLSGGASLAFVGLDDPPQTPADAPGLKLTLHAAALGSVGVGSPVFHHGIPVGKVDAYRLDEQGEGLQIDIYIEPEYAHHVTVNTRFWNASGIDISMGAEGIKFTAASFVSLLTGGVEFGTPPDARNGAPAQSGASYRLFPDRSASNEVFSETREFVAYFSGSVRGLAPGAPVELRGIKMGTVREYEMVFTSPSESHVRVVIDIQPERFGAKFEEGVPPSETLSRSIQAGLRVQLASGSLLTGALYVDVVIEPESPAVFRGQPDELEVPTIPSTSDALAAMAGELPLLMTDARRVVGGLAELVNSAETKGAMGELNQASASAREALEQVTRVLDSIEGKLDAQSSLQVRVAKALEELAAGMRSVRHLADMLERQPEALLHGKSGSSGD